MGDGRLARQFFVKRFNGNSIIKLGFVASELINGCRSEFPGRDFVLKEDVEFTICPVFGFGKPEIRPDET